MPTTAAALLLLAIAAALWLAAVQYTRRTYTQIACRACDGSGKDWEPVWLALLCFRTRRRFRTCPACGGAGRFHLRDK